MFLKKHGSIAKCWYHIVDAGILSGLRSNSCTICARLSVEPLGGTPNAVSYSIGMSFLLLKAIYIIWDVNCPLFFTTIK